MKKILEDILNIINILATLVMSILILVFASMLFESFLESLAVLCLVLVCFGIRMLALELICRMEYIEMKKSE